MAKKVLYIAIDAVTNEILEFHDWPTCQQAIKGKNYIFKGFTQNEVDNNAHKTFISQKLQTVDETAIELNEKNVPYAFVDGSCDASWNDCSAYSYGVAIVKNNEEVFTKYKAFNDKFVNMYQIMGELRGALEAVHWCIKNGYKKMYLIHDYEGISNFAIGTWDAKNKDIKKYYVIKMKEMMKDIDITFVKVKSHVSDKSDINKWNDRADELANLALGRKKKENQE